MSVYIVFPAAPEHRRSSGKNTFVVSAGSAAAARTSAEVLAVAQVGSFNSTTHTTTVLSDDAGQDCTIAIQGPVGAAWPVQAPGA